MKSRHNNYWTVYMFLFALTFSIMMIWKVPAQAADFRSETFQQTLLQEGALQSVVFSTDEESVLTGESWEIAFREIVKNALDNFEMNVELSFLEIPWENAEAVSSVYFDVLNSNPRYFYMQGECDVEGQGAYIGNLKMIPKLQYRNGESIDAVKAGVDFALYEEKIQQAMLYINDNMSDVEKALALHDFLVRECDYDYENYLNGTIPEVSYSGYGALVENVAVCNGYALAYGDLLDRAGLENVFVSSRAMNHAWNMVYIDGYWHHVDTTWDDPVWPDGTFYDSMNDYWNEGYVGHDYFLKSDLQLYDHYGWVVSAQYGPITAEHHGKYEDYFFRNSDGASCYLNGYWYYLDWWGRIFKSKIDASESERQQITADKYFRYMHVYGQYLYLVDESGLYRMNAAGEISEVMLLEETEYAGSEIVEFTIKNNSMVLVLRDGKRYDRVLQRMPGSCFIDGQHTVVVIPQVEATCLASGTTQGRYCSDCGTVFEAQVIIPQKPHQLITIGEYKEATCLASGMTSGEKCSICGTVTTVPQEIPRKEHQLIVFGGKAASCGVAGSTDGQKCSICGTVTVAPQPIPAKQHSWDNGTVTKESTSTSWGVITYRCLHDASHTYTERFISPTDTNPFGDVLESSWQFNAAKYAYDNNIMAGKGTVYGGGIKFAPDGHITRSEFAQVLYNMEGKPRVSYVGYFTDVSNGAWYTNAVTWVKQNNIASGRGDGSFGVNAKITRQDLAVMLYKYAVKCGYDTTYTEGLVENYADGSTVAGYAKTALNWAVSQGIISGKGTAGAATSTFRLDPVGNATRAECASMMMKLIQKNHNN